MSSDSSETITIGQGTVISTGDGQGGTAQLTQSGPARCWPAVGTTVTITGVAQGGVQPADSQIGLLWKIVNSDCQTFLWGTGPIK